MAEKPNPVQTGTPQPKGRYFTPYVIIWATLASLSLVYLALLLAQPALVASVLGASPSAQTAEMAQERRAAAEAVSEVRVLRENVDHFRDDLQELKAEVATHSDRERDLTTRLAALEAPAAVDPKLTIAEKRAAAKAAKTAAAEAPANVVVATVPPAKTAPVAKRPEPLETGSVAAPAAGAVSFGPAVVTPSTKTALTPAPSKQIGVQIATGPSVDSLRLSWTLLSERHGEALTSLQPRYTTGSDGSGTTFDLVVGPISSAAEAKRLCQELAAKATPCTLSAYTGDVL